MTGIDVSHHNGQINWQQVAASNAASFVFIKATEGQTYVDPTLGNNASGAGSAGLRVGYYHFATLNSTSVVSDARAEAAFFLSAIQTLPTPSLPLILDIEANKIGLSPNGVLLWINTFFSWLVAAGYHEYALYSYTPFLNANLPVNHRLGSIPLWIAAYVNAPAPVLPTGWTAYWIWQYTDNGTVPGINAPVDMNRTSRL